MSYERTPEHRARMSRALKGRKKTAEHRAALSRAKTGTISGKDNPNYRHGEWYRGGREKARVFNADTAAKKYGADSSLTLDEWLVILDEYEHRCAYCFAPFQELDHIKELFRGGTNTRDNVAPACRTCNKRKVKGGGWVPSIASRFWPRLAEELYAR